jgi:hypothetical protein
MIFNNPSYHLVNNIYLKNLELFYSIDKINNNNNIIRIDLKNNGYIEFDIEDHAEQLDYLTSFFDSIDIYSISNFFEYIKFMGLNIIIKEVT